MHSTEALLTRVDGWLADAKAHPGIEEPTAMLLATATKQAAPSSRVVLLKAHDVRGFCFFTNYEGRKSQELIANPQAALIFYWMPLKRQLRIEGLVERTSEAESDAYFASRHRQSQLGAWASAQSRPMDTADALQARMEEMAKTFDGKPVPRPPHWGGWRVVPHGMEFWQEGAHRLHTRQRYTRQGEQWAEEYLYP